ncbi:fusaric acid resistance-like protein [Rhizoctonia solani AG-3 Rhs1AP]|uniref:Fusaric acid resistance-like protein n=1 Tax=Rhizoctonia solani AG-3 Rhs1AP TaxID=1086054 RepID=A0A0A1ULR0_9AGAM|nr:fusaric acid resistance-like protein [Rhizoctonia solani AG-3 Rhs1AP]
MSFEWPSFVPPAHLVARMCVTFICSVIIVLRPVAFLGGPYLFLILTAKELVFPPSTSPSAQIEATVVNMAGALFGLGWSNLGLVCATYAARQYGVDSDAPRTIRAVFLLILGFLTGLSRSWLPRLTFASRAAGLVSAFLLTTDLDSTKWVYTSFTQLLFVFSIACAASLFVAFGARIFVPAGGYAKDAINALGLLKGLVNLATTRTIDSPIEELVHSSSPTLTVTENPVSASPGQSLETLQQACLDASLALYSSYAYSAFELRIGRVPINLVRPLLTTIGRVREELAWGVVHATQSQPHHDDSLSKDEIELLATLDDPSRSCADSIGDSISALQCAIGLCYGFHVPGCVCLAKKPNSIESGAKEGKHTHPKPRTGRNAELSRMCLSNIHAERERLTDVREALKKQLDAVVKEMNDAHMLKTVGGGVRSREGSPTRPEERHHNQLFRKSLYATSLLHISSEITRALALMLSVLELHISNRPRIFFLRPSWMWLGMSPRALVFEAQKEDGGSDEDAVTDAVGLSMQEAKQGVFQRRDTALSMSPIIISTSPVPFWKRLQGKWRTIRSTPLHQTLSNLVNFPQRMLILQWNKSSILKFRVHLSRTVRRVQHSKHARHAIKHAFGMTLLAIPSFLPLGSAGRTYFVSQRGVWAIISFVYVLEPNTASTWRVGVMRLCGTCIGAVYAYVTWAICRNNPYGIVIMITVGEIMITWLIRSSTPGVGVVASITMPPIIFTPYLGLPHSSVIGLAVLRGAQVSIGIVAAILINHFIFPRHCRVMFLEGMARVLAKQTKLFLHLSQRTLNEAARTRKGMVRGAQMDLKLREMIAREKLLLTQMDHEVSLMPKPTRLYREGTETVQRIADLMSGLRKIRENVPHREAIHQVLQHRQQTISCICIVLFTCEHAFRSRQPLPQILPSPRKAFDELRREMMDALQSAPRATDVAYAIAENEVYDELIDALEHLIIITRELFGTNAWLLDGACSIGFSGMGMSGGETPGVHSSAASLRRVESFHHGF